MASPPVLTSPYWSRASSNLQCVYCWCRLCWSNQTTCSKSNHMFYSRFKLWSTIYRVASDLLQSTAFIGRAVVNGGNACNDVPPVSVHPNECNLVTRHPVIIFADERRTITIPVQLDRLAGTASWLMHHTDESKSHPLHLFYRTDRCKVRVRTK